MHFRWVRVDLEEPGGDNRHLNAWKMAVARELFARGIAVSLWRQPLRVSTAGTGVYPSSMAVARNSSSYSEFQLSVILVAAFLCQNIDLQMVLFSPAYYYVCTFSQAT